MDLQEKTAMLRQMNLNKIADGTVVCEHVGEMCKDPMNHQEALLMKLLEDNKDTEYGKKCGFGEITSIAEYQRCVPVTQYDDYAEYISRMTEKGEKNLITVYPVNHYNKSSGTIGTPKKIPMSDPGVDIFQKYSARYISGVLGRDLGTDWVCGNSMSIAEAMDQLPTLINGETYCALSWRMIQSARPVLHMVTTSPDEAIFPVIGTDTKYLHARFGLAEEMVTNISCAFSGFIYSLLRYIRDNWRLLVKDIEEGTIDESIHMSVEVRTSLMKKIVPMPHRAVVLRKIFEEHENDQFVSLVWPNIQYFVMVATGSFKTDAEKIRTQFTGDKVAQFRLGLSASEGVFTIPVALNQDDAIFIPDSIFYEFLPLDAGDDFSKIVTMDALEEGKEYELIITNLSGFYRYRLRDAVRITGKYYDMPTSQYLYRLDAAISVMGEKTREPALRFAAERTADELGFQLLNYSVYADTDVAPPRYQYFLEIEKLPANVSPKIVRLTLEKYLAEANPSMGDKVKKGVCAPTRVNFLELESNALYQDVLVYKGAARSQIKPVIIINNELQRRFYFSRVEYSSDVL